MVLYICKRCGHNSSKKSDFIAHIQRKSKCPNINNIQNYSEFDTISKEQLDYIISISKANLGGSTRSNSSIVPVTIPSEPSPPKPKVSEKKNLRKNTMQILQNRTFANLSFIKTFS